MFLPRASDWFTPSVSPRYSTPLFERGIFWLILAGLNLLNCESPYDAAYITELAANSTLFAIVASISPLFCNVFSKSVCA